MHAQRRDEYKTCFKAKLTRKSSGVWQTSDAHDEFHKLYVYRYTHSYIHLHILIYIHPYIQTRTPEYLNIMFG